MINFDDLINKWKIQNNKLFPYLIEGDLKISVKICINCKNFEWFINKTNRFLESNIQEFVHNLSVIKSAAFLTLKYYNVEFLKENLNKNPDLKLVDKKGKVSYCEIKTKYEDLLEELLKSFSDKIPTNKDYKTDVWLDEKFLKDGTIKEKEEILLDVCERIGVSIKILQDGEYKGIRWKFLPRFKSNTATKSISRFSYNFWDSIWIKDQIDNAIKKMEGKEFIKYIIVLDHKYCSNKEDYTKFVKEWKLTQKDKRIILIWLKFPYWANMEEYHKTLVDDFIEFL